MLRKLCLFLTIFALSVCAFAQESRHFTFHYAFTVKNLPANKTVHIWIPEAKSDAFQEVKVISVKSDLPLKRTHESKYGNEIYFAESKSAFTGSAR